MRAPINLISATATVAVALSLASAPGAHAQSKDWHRAAPPAIPGASSTSASELFSYAARPFDLDPAIESPEAFLGHALGERWTRHHQVIDYLEYLANSSDRITLREYGTSTQHRPLVLLTITAPSNHGRMDAIVRDNAALTDPRTLSSADRSRIIENNPAIAWLSYNVHGNEPSCTEAALQVAYTLAAARDQRVLEWLDNLVVVIDPCLNPDGRERYLAFYDTNVGLRPDAAEFSSEHDEPWPGGRSNHYYFDLNRDWVWGVHKESAARVAQMRALRPQLHVDYHEQGFRSPYFFGAGDTPYHAVIPRSTRDWLDVYGRANAERFDELGLPFFTKEQFDYLYPGYGKVLPVYHGAVGLLTEQAGHSRGGLAIALDERNTLTLFERIRNHFITSLSNIEATADNRAGQLERFAGFFAGSMELDEGGPAAFVIAADNDPAKLAMLWDLCSLHGIEAHTLDADTTLTNAANYESPGTIDEVIAPAGSWVIRADQPMGLLVRSLMAIGTPLEDIDTYDITAWSVPPTWGLRAWSVPAAIEADTAPLRSFDWPPALRPHAGDTPWTPRNGRTPAAIVVPSDQHLFPRAAALAGEHGLHARLAGKAMTLDTQEIPAGSLIVYRVRNDDDPIHRFQSELTRAGVRWSFAFTSFPDAGSSLASNDHPRFEAPRIALLRGEGISSLSYGHLWHLLDRHMPMPYHQVNAGGLSRSALDEVNVIVLPESWSWSDILSGAQREALDDWIRRGGTLVAIGTSATWASRELLDLDPSEKIEPPVDGAHEPPDGPASGGSDDDSDDDESGEGERAALNRLSYEQRAERSVEDRVPGSLVRIRFDTTHPLAFGLDAWCGVIRRSSRTLPLSSGGYAVARIDAHAPLIDGYLSESNTESLKGQAWITHHRVGSGKVVCIADDPAFRGFTHAAARAFLNAIVFGPSF
ncbi:MAG: M14 family zinc carboxypeptidase [Phycisphaerales bacterium]